MPKSNNYEMQLEFIEYATNLHSYCDIVSDILASKIVLTEAEKDSIIKIKMSATKNLNKILTNLSKFENEGERE